MSASIKRVSALLLIAFVLLAVALGYWSISGSTLVIREDNPRLIIAEQRILRGAILDRTGELIVESRGDLGVYQRYTHYPYAAPFAGYYSINYGTSGVESEFDDILRGKPGIDATQAAINSLLHIDPIGQAVQLTIDLRVQRMADELLGDLTGAVVVMSIPDGDILALSSHPTFDPNMLDESWDILRADPRAPLLNRATQGQYQPGTMLQPLLLIEALKHNLAALDDTPDLAAKPFTIESHALTCRGNDEIITLGDALRSACPQPFAQIGVLLGDKVLQEMIATWQLTATNAIGIESAPALTETILLTNTQALREFAVGQGALTITPLQMASVAATLATQGIMPVPRLVSATQTIENVWQPVDSQPARRVLSVASVRAVIDAMAHTDNIVWHAAQALSGPAQLHWFIGFRDGDVDQTGSVVVVLVEEDNGALRSSDGIAIEIGLALLTALPD